MDCVKHLKKKIKREKKHLLFEQDDNRQMGLFEDCGDFYREKVLQREARIEALIEQKISMEKYAKKLKHMAIEAA